MTLAPDCALPRPRPADRSRPVRAFSRCLGAAPLLAVLALAPGLALGQAARTDDRIAVSGNGSSLTGTSGGGGGSVSWLHNFDPGTLAAVAAEHEVLANAHWTFGSITGSMSGGADALRYGVYAEAHEGAGDDGPRAFRYEVEAVGVTATFRHQLSVVAEDRRIDVETSHGNLPKLGLYYLWSPHLQLGISNQHSVSGNLGTTLTALRVDGYGSAFNWLAGVAYGQAAPAIYGVISTSGSGASRSALLAAAPLLHEGYLGVTKPFPRLRSELTLVADYLDLSGVKRATVTLTYIVHVGASGR